MYQIGLLVLLIYLNLKASLRAPPSKNRCADVGLAVAKVCARREQKRSFIPNLFGKVGVLGVPFGKGQKCTGIKEEGLVQAPDILRTTGFMEDLKCMGVDVCDYGNVCYTPAGPDICCENMINLNHFAPCAKEVFSQMRRILAEGRICLTLGGDHSLAAGTISGHMSHTGPNDIAVIYVDAHADINTCQTSDTGNIHGMPLALLTREIAEHWPRQLPGLQWISSVLSARNLAYIGLRSIDPWESYFIKRHGICAFTMEDVQKFGSQNVVSKALDHVDPDNRKSIHLSFDIDSLDYFEAPCTTVPVRGGLTLREALDITEALYTTTRLAAIDLVEVSPLLGNTYQRQITLDAARYVILSLFGQTRRGRPY